MVSGRSKFRTSRLDVVLLLMSLLSAPAVGQQQQNASPSNLNNKKKTVQCAIESLPLDIQVSLKKNFSSWMIQQPRSLNANARERWEAERPIECPGIAIGHFKCAKSFVYAILLVSHIHGKDGYKFLVFSPKIGKSSYEVTLLNQSCAGNASSVFIHKEQISKFFDERSLKHIHACGEEGILFADAGERQYETDVYFWANGSFGHEPVDY